MSHPTDTSLRSDLIDAALRHVPFDGWSQRMVQAVAAECDVSAAEIDMLFPRGVGDMIDAWFARLSAEMTAAVQTSDTPSTTKRIRLALTSRFEAMAPHREAVRQTLIYFSLPGRQRQASGSLYQAVDAMWCAAGVYDTDFNFYTKRALLAGVYSSSLLYWLTEEGQDEAQLAAFIDRRLAGVMRIQKYRGRIEKRMQGLCDVLPSPLAIATRLRYGRRTAANAEPI